MVTRFDKDTIEQMTDRCNKIMTVGGYRMSDNLRECPCGQLLWLNKDTGLWECSYCGYSEE